MLSVQRSGHSVRRLNVLPQSAKQKRRVMGPLINFRILRRLWRPSSVLPRSFQPKKGRGAFTVYEFKCSCSVAAAVGGTQPFVQSLYSSCCCHCYFYGLWRDGTLIFDVILGWFPLETRTFLPSFHSVPSSLTVWNERYKYAEHGSQLWP